MYVNLLISIHDRCEGTTTATTTTVQFNDGDFSKFLFSNDTILLSTHHDIVSLSFQRQDSINTDIIIVVVVITGTIAVDTAAAISNCNSILYHCHRLHLVHATSSRTDVSKLQRHRTAESGTDTKRIRTATEAGRENIKFWWEEEKVINE